MQQPISELGGSNPNFKGIEAILAIYVPARLIIQALTLRDVIALAAASKSCRESSHVCFTTSLEYIHSAEAVAELLSGAWRGVAVHWWHISSEQQLSSKALVPLLNSRDMGVMVDKPVPHSCVADLARLCLSNLKISNLPGLVALTELKLDHCFGKLDNDSVACLTNLTCLTISNCHNIEALPDALCQLTQLSSVQVRTCPRLSSLPERLGSVPLKTLIFTKCPLLHHLPRSILQCKTLQTVVLGCPAGPNAPLNSLTGVRMARIIYNFLQTRQPSIKAFGAHLSVLDLSRHCFDWSDLRSSAVPHLRQLCLRACDPRGCIDDTFPRVVRLCLAHCNRMQEMPKGSETIETLETLEVLGCQRLTAVPEASVSLPNLRTLRFVNTPIESLPDCFGALQELRLVNLCQTKMKQLPQSLLLRQSLGAVFISSRPTTIDDLQMETAHIMASESDTAA